MIYQNRKIKLPTMLNKKSYIPLNQKKNFFKL